MNKPAPVIVLTGGGSGGHITPLLSLARELKNQSPDCQIIYIGHKGDKFDTFQTSGHDFDFMAFIRAGKLRRFHGHFLGGMLHPKTLLLNIIDLLRFPSSFLTARRVLKRFKPSIVFSKGSFVAVPVGLAARSLGIPIITHDSDSAPGLANRIVGHWAKIHATGMPADSYPYKQSSIKFVGIPIDPRIKKAVSKLQTAAKLKLGFPKDSTVILLSGGGNGSKRLNDLMLAVAPDILQTNLAARIVHLTGRLHESEVKTAYDDLPEPLRARVSVLGFSNDFYAYLTAADIVITRAGATTLAELAAAGKATIVIPAPFLTGGHQLKNAEYLEQKDAAVVLPNETTPDELLAIINSLISNDHRRFELARNLYATAITDASARLASLIIQTAGK